MTQPTISAERIEEMLAPLVNPLMNVPDETLIRLPASELREVLTLALSALRAQAQGSEAVAWEETDTDRMQKISEVITHLQSVHERFGDTCVYIRRGGMSWGAVALNRLDDDKKNGVFDLQAQHDRDMTARLQQVQRLIDDNRALRASPPVQAQPQAEQTMLLVENYVSANLREARGSTETWEKDVTSVGNAKQLLLAALTASRAAVAQDETP